MEIQKEAYSFSAELQIGEQLWVMNSKNRFDAFQFNHDAIFNNQIHFVTAIQSHVLIYNR